MLIGRKENVVCLVYLKRFAGKDAEGGDIWQTLQDTLHISPVAAQKLSFGPVREHTLPLSDLGFSHSLDPVSGVAKMLPPILTMADWSSGISLPDGIIIVAPSTNRALMVAGTGTQVTPLLNSSDPWENPQSS